MRTAHPPALRPVHLTPPLLGHQGERLLGPLVEQEAEVLGGLDLGLVAAHQFGDAALGGVEDRGVARAPAAAAVADLLERAVGGVALRAESLQVGEGAPARRV